MSGSAIMPARRGKRTAALFILILLVILILISRRPASSQAGIRIKRKIMIRRRARKKADIML
jgi:hypothetical protein